MVDFELDVTSISLGTIVFSESVGAYTEIGMFSCFTELHKNFLVIVPEQYIQEKNSSFFNYGAILKIKESMLSDELRNIWALDKCLINATEYDKLFSNISDHFLNIITSNKASNKVKLDNNNRHHIILLLLDLIDLFPSNNMGFYQSVLSKFDININRESFKKIISLLSLLNLVIVRDSGNNVLYKLNDSYSYTACIDYQAKHPKRFERSDFKIRMRGK